MDAVVPVERLWARAYTIPTDFPEADGTAAWDATTIVVAWAEAGGRQGIGYSYAAAAAARLITKILADVVKGVEAMNPPEAWRKMQVALRNQGRPGLCSCAISAVDVALWDLKAALLDAPLSRLIGAYRPSAPIYGSGGFTTYDDRRLERQLAGWVEKEGCRWVKMKIGREPARDAARVATAKRAIGSAGLFVDANGAYGRKQALVLAEQVGAEQDVKWFEEPVSSDDLVGLRQIRERAPLRMEIAAGEYGYILDDFHRMLRAEAVDVQQADATRCGGVTGFLQVAALCEAHHIDLSAHCAPALHRHLGCAAPRFRHLEWFHDHVRVERMLFDGAPQAANGSIAPDLSRSGVGLSFKERDAEQYEVHGAGA